jgi:hypothetical protein
MWELWRQDDHGREFLVRGFDDQADAEAAREQLAARGHHQAYWVIEKYALGRYVELYPTIQSERGGSIPSGTRGIVDAIDASRPAGDCYLVGFLDNERRTGEQAWLRWIDLFPA